MTTINPIRNIELFFNQEQVAKIPVNILVENSPMYDRKWKKSKLPKKNKILDSSEGFTYINEINTLRKIISNYSKVNMQSLSKLPKR